MITVSEKFNELMQSNARPKAVPTIRTLGLINNKEWKTTDIVDWEWVHYIDPLGAEPSYIELRWNEIVTDKRKLNSLSHDMATNNVAVELTIKQDLAWYVSWESLENKTWAELEEMTWEEIETNVPYEEITFPKLFIAGKPQTNNTTIAWTAKDILSVSDFAVKKFFPASVRKKAVAPLQNMIADQRAYYIDNTEMVKTLTESIVSLSAQQTTDGQEILQAIYVDGSDNVRDVYRLYARINGWSINFGENGKIKYSHYNQLLADYDFELNLDKMFTFPNMVQNEQVAKYKYTRQTVDALDTNATETTPSPSDIINGGQLYKKEFTVPTEVVISPGYSVDDGFTYYSWENSPIRVIPYEFGSVQEEYILSRGAGLVYEEDNKLYGGTYNDTFDVAMDVYNYYNNSYEITVDILPIHNIQAGDYVKFNTGYQDENGNNIIIGGIVKNNKFKYNGAIKQTIEVHGVKL